MLRVVLSLFPTEEEELATALWSIFYQTLTQLLQDKEKTTATSSPDITLDILLRSLKEIKQQAEDVGVTSDAIHALCNLNSWLDSYIQTRPKVNSTVVTAKKSLSGLMSSLPQLENLHKIDHRHENSNNNNNNHHNKNKNKNNNNNNNDSSPKPKRQQQQ